jgi:coenzyme F420-reducing hydrogenase delta subunit
VGLRIDECPYILGEVMERDEKIAKLKELIDEYGDSEHHRGSVCWAGNKQEFKSAHNQRNVDREALMAFIETHV